MLAINLPFYSGISASWFLLSIQFEMKFSPNVVCFERCIRFCCFFKVLCLFGRIKLNMSNVEPAWIPFHKDLMKEKEVARKFAERPVFAVKLPLHKQSQTSVCMESILRLCFFPNFHLKGKQTWRKY